MRCCSILDNRILRLFFPFVKGKNGMFLFVAVDMCQPFFYVLSLFYYFPRERMLTLLLYDMEKQAKFVLKGLHYENLSCEAISSREFSLNGSSLDNYDGVIFLLDSPEAVAGLCPGIRAIRPSLPLISMSGHNSPVYSGLLHEKLIDFHFVRPFSLRIIANRMRYAIYSVKERLDVSRLAIRDLELDIMTHTVTYRGRKIDLRNREFALLQFLMSNSGRVLSRSSILENVWDHNSNFLTNTVDVHISQLRKKIDTFAKDKFIHTVPCTGYLLV